MPLLLSISIGAVIGALGRHYVMLLVKQFGESEFPWGTIVVNVSGSLIMGILVGLFTFKLSVSQEVRALLVVGMLGSFTTFSTFSLDVVLLVERGQIAQAAGYFLLSGLASVAALFIGMQAMRVLYS